MTRFFISLSIIVLLSVSTAQAHPSDSFPLSRIDAYLNDYSRLQARFTQTAPDGGIGEGMLYLERPGKMRWDYAPPHPVVMVASGAILTYYDRELAQTSHLSLDDHWLGVLTKSDLRLNELPQLQTITREMGEIHLLLAQEEGSVTLSFSESPLILKRLAVVDATGQSTLITLADIRRAEPFSKDFFTLRDALKNN